MLVSRHLEGTSTPNETVTDDRLYLVAAGFKPIALQATTKYVRAARGGTGSFKLGAK